MPASTRPKRKPKNSSPATPSTGFPVIKSLLVAALSGAVLGLSAPGLNQWYLAWVGLVPFCLLLFLSSTIWEAWLISTAFGFTYNLVYLNWYLGLHPLTWLGFTPWQSMLLAGGAWVAEAFHQGVIIGLVALFCRCLPLTGEFFPSNQKGQWRLPSWLIIPTVWVLIENKLGNAPGLLGVPWSMLEYSQYLQPAVIQITSVIGGIGLSWFIVMVNIVIAGLIATISKHNRLKPLACATTSSAIMHALVAGLAFFSIFFWGKVCISSLRLRPTTSISVLQGNFNIEMQRSKHHYTLDELLGYYRKLPGNAPTSGLCVWTENALPAYLLKEPDLKHELARIATAQNTDQIIGALDQDQAGHSFNSVYGITSGGTILPLIYHKRYLVPFGEYTPELAKHLPDWLKHLTNTPAGTGFSSGQKTVVLSFPSGKVAPLICFEALSPELAQQSIKASGQLLVNLCDLAWFHRSMIGDQMIAFSVLRAVENHRYFVFAANSGPSAIIDPDGRIIARLSPGTEQRLTGHIEFCSQKTIFSRWFH